MFTHTQKIDQLQPLTGIRHADLDKLYRYYVGNQYDVCNDIFGSRALTPNQLSELDKYKVYCNLTAPSVSRIVSGVYGGVVNRTIEKGTPYKTEIEKYISPNKGYGQAVRNWFQNAVLFGTGYLVWRIHNGKPKPYLPNPIFTEVDTDSFDIEDITELREFSADGNRYWYVNKFEYGVKDKDGNRIGEPVEHGLGIVPVTIARGESLVSYGRVYGLSLVRDSVAYSQIISRLQLNLVELVKTYTRPQAVMIGEADLAADEATGGEETIEEAFKPGGVLPLKEGGNYLYASPNAQFEQIIKTIEKYKKDYCLSSGIPLDALDSSTIDPNQSATAARLRAQPLQTALQRLTEEQKNNEIDAIQKLAAVIQWLDTGEEVTFSDIQDKVNVSISMEPAGTPESRTEEVSAWISLYNAGVKTLSDLIRHFNGSLSESEIEKRVQDLERHKSAVPAPRAALEKDLGENPIEPKPMDIGDGESADAQN